jgi:hypothetical protein
MLILLLASSGETYYQAALARTYLHFHFIIMSDYGGDNFSLMHQEEIEPIKSYFSNA